MTTRMTAAKDAAGDKVDEKKHEVRLTPFITSCRLLIVPSDQGERLRQQVGMPCATEASYRSFELGEISSND